MFTPSEFVPGQVVTGPANSKNGDTMLALCVAYFVDHEFSSGMVEEPEYAPLTKKSVVAAATLVGKLPLAVP